jgi:hypothetical protein
VAVSASTGLFSWTSGLSASEEPTTGPFRGRCNPATEGNYLSWSAFLSRITRNLGGGVRFNLPKCRSALPPLPTPGVRAHAATHWLESDIARCLLACSRDYACELENEHALRNSISRAMRAGERGSQAAGIRVEHGHGVDLGEKVEERACRSRRGSVAPSSGARACGLGWSREGAGARAPASQRACLPLLVKSDIPGRDPRALRSRVMHHGRRTSSLAGERHGLE